MPALSKYNPEYHDDWAWSLAIKGATNDEIAEAFGISIGSYCSVCTWFSLGRFSQPSPWTRWRETVL